MSSVFDNNLKLSLFGQSHGPAVGMVLDGIPAGLPVDFIALQKFLDRRAPGRDPLSSSRKEMDIPEFLGGIYDGYTCGAPIAAVIHNNNTRPGDYDVLNKCPRPGHADFTAHIKHGGFQDPTGGGHFSGRLTAPLCIAGGLCLQWLQEQGIQIGAHILNIGNITDISFNPITPEISAINSHFPVLSIEQGNAMADCIRKCRDAGNSIGGVIECAVTGLPAGIGEPMFGGVENHIAQIIFGIPAVKGIEFGSCCEDSAILGSTANDPFSISGEKVVTVTNRSGGILGGISTGMPLIFRIKIKPTPSITTPQQSVCLDTLQPQVISVKGRHDPCIVPRAVCVAEAAAAIAVYDLILGNTQSHRRKNNGAKGSTFSN